MTNPLRQLISGEFKQMIRYNLLARGILRGVIWLIILLLISKGVAENVASKLIFVDASIVSMLLLGLSFYREQKENTIQSMLVLPVSLWQILLTKALSSLVLTLIPVAVTCAAVYFIHDVTFNYALLLFFVILTVAAHAAVGFCFELFGKRLGHMLIMVYAYVFIFAVPTLLLALNIINVQHEWMFTLSPAHTARTLFSSVVYGEFEWGKTLFNCIYLPALAAVLMKFVVYPKFKSRVVEDVCFYKDKQRKGEKKNASPLKNDSLPLMRGISLSKTYRMGEVEVKALRQADFTIFNREFIVILGPSGSGKSTLLNIIGGMDTPTGGEVYYQGQPLHTASPKELTYYRRNAVGFVFQFYNLMPNLTAYENISLSAQISASPLSIEETLEKVGLAPRADSFPSQLSGGEQQRIALARALVKNPDLLLCDEPTGALDLQTGIQVLKLLREFCDAYGKTVVVITHNTGISQMADRVFYLRDGCLSRVEVNENPVPPEGVNW